MDKANVTPELRRRKNGRARRAGPQLRRGWRDLVGLEFQTIQDAASVAAPMALQAAAQGLWRAGLRDEARLVNAMANDLLAIER